MQVFVEMEPQFNKDSQPCITAQTPVPVTAAGPEPQTPTFQGTQARRQEPIIPGWRREQWSCAQ